MSNHEKRTITDQVHLFLGLQRAKDGEQSKCIRHVIKDNEQLDLQIFEAKLKLIGGTWRIHKTVNARDVHKARKILIHRLIEHPEQAYGIDTLWRTALLQSECKAETKFLLDVDSTNEEEIDTFRTNLPSDAWVHTVVKTPNGWHYVTDPFDTRKILELKYVTLHRDGYIFIKKVE